MAEQNMEAAEGTYNGFVSMVKIGSIVTALLVALVVILIS